MPFNRCSKSSKGHWKREHISCTHTLVTIRHISMTRLYFTWCDQELHRLQWTFCLFVHRYTLVPMVSVLITNAWCSTDVWSVVLV